MKEIFKSKYSRLFLAGFVLNIICAWFSVGFHQADEHFQVLEFCNFKLGHLSAGDLVWEYQQKIRSSLLPDMAYVIARCLYWWGVYSPFLLAFIVRLFAGIASWFIACKFCLLLSPRLKTPAGEKLLVIMSMFLWFIPYINVRFTSENISAIALLSGIYFIMRSEIKNTKNYSVFIIAGLFLGMSYFIRSQMIFAIAGLLAWLVFIKKTEWKYLLVLSFSVIVAIGINILADYWFYGSWTFTPYNYYYANIIQHKSADFGINPWWFYFADFVIRAVPPISLLLLFMFFTGMFNNLKDLMVWVFVPFFIFHCIMGHKEMRFLFPVAFVFIYITSLGFDYFLAKNYYQKMHKYIYALVLIIFIPLLVFRTLVPAHASVNYFKYLYNYSTIKDPPFFILRNDDYYNIYGLNSGFYKTPSLKTIPLDSLGQMNGYLQANKPRTALLLCRQNIPEGESVQGYKTKMVYCYFPSWILKFDFNNWEERTQIWRVYEFDKVE